MIIDKFDEIDQLDLAIAKVLSALEETDAGSDEFSTMSDQLTKLIKNKETIGTLKLKAQELANKAREFEESNNLKATELLSKKEFESKTHSLKEKELELRVKELVEREAETQETHNLKKRELDMKQQEFDKPDKVSKETLALIGANILGIAMVIGYERLNVIAGKAFGLIRNVR